MVVAVRLEAPNTGCSPTIQTRGNNNSLALKDDLTFEQFLNPDIDTNTVVEPIVTPYASKVQCVRILD